MLLYLDTSSLVKLYVQEEGSRKITDQVSASNVVATSFVAYAEARAAFARRFREKALTTEDYADLVSAFDRDWDNYLMIQVTLELVRLAGNLAEKYGLRGFDAIHLASAVTFQRETDSPILFSCADNKLQDAAQREELSLV